MSSAQENAAENAAENAPAPDDTAKKDTVRGIIVNLIGFTLLGSIGSGLQVFELALVSLGVNWFVYLVHGLPQDSEKFYDATGTLTYVTLVVWAVVKYGLLSSYTESIPALVLVCMSLVWTLRLGSFLLARVCAAGKDSRFGELRRNKVRWLGVWTIQSVWCFLVISPVLVAVKNASTCATIGSSPSVVDYISWAVWLLAFIFEVVADNQKSAWRKIPANQGRFITTGLWAYSRHPNYFGEIMMWVAITTGVTVGGCLSPWQYLIWFSPLTTYGLLKYLSGVPLLEKQGQARWGNEPAYQWYVANTPEIFPTCSPKPFNPEGNGVTLV